MLRVITDEFSSPRDAGGRSPLVVPKEHECFASPFNKKNALGLFLGKLSSERPSNARAQFSRTRCMAVSVFNNGVSALEPTEFALERTKLAAKHFFSLSHSFLTETGRVFPLASRNKCLGMVAVPHSKLVILAISQDKNPVNDELLRSDMVSFLEQLNLRTDERVFELACIPTKSQYLMPRTFFMRTPHQAPQESVEPHTRCVEVALMAALNKIGRFSEFNASDTGIIAFGGTLWASEDAPEAIPSFGSAERNKKYTSQRPLEVIFPDEMRGWVDIWDPCGGHCAIYKYEMLAIGASGGPATSFMEPRSESLASTPSI